MNMPKKFTFLMRSVAIVALTATLSANSVLAEVSSSDCRGYCAESMARNVADWTFSGSVQNEGVLLRTPVQMSRDIWL